MKRVIKFLFIVYLLIGIIFTSVVVSHAQTINDGNVFLKQPPNSVTCTLVSTTMMVRRKALLLNNTNWSSITPNTMESSAWIQGQGLRNSFYYAGIGVSCGYFSGDKINQLISLLSTHPEGIVTI